MKIEERVQIKKNNNNQVKNSWRNIEVLSKEELDIAQTKKYDFKLSAEELENFSL